MSHATREHQAEDFHRFAYRPITFYGRAFHPVRLRIRLFIRQPPPADPQIRPLTSHDPEHAKLAGHMHARFRLFPVRSPLLRESRLLSFPEGTEMFHFPSFASPGYELFRTMGGMNPHGFPHSEIPGSMPVSSSPGLIAAVHVLHRLPTPRHPSHALSSLTITRDFSWKSPAGGSYRRRWREMVRVQNKNPLRRKIELTREYPVFKELARHRVPHSHGADRARTDDIQLAKLALSQLSYSPTTP